MHIDIMTILKETIMILLSIIVAIFKTHPICAILIILCLIGMHRLNTNK